MQRTVWQGREFVIERERLRVRAHELGVFGSVDVRLVRYRNRRGTVACVKPLEVGGWRIVVDTMIDAVDASLSVYHELAHVLQAQAIGGWGRLIAQQRREMVAARLIGPNPRKFFIDRARERMPLEWDAEARAYAWHDQMPLAERRS